MMCNFAIGPGRSPRYIGHLIPLTKLKTERDND